MVYTQAQAAKVTKMATKPMKKITPSMDAKMDKKAGIKPGSAKDNALDKQRGVPVKPMAKTGRKTMTKR